MGGRREVSILPHRPVTSSDLKQERLCFCESVSTFLQLVVATGVRVNLCSITHINLIFWQVKISHLQFSNKFK